MANEFLQRFEVLLAVALLIPALALALLAALNKEIIFWRYASAGMLSIALATALSAAIYLKPASELILASNLLCVFGYYLCSKSIRQVYGFKHWLWLEEAGLFSFSLAFILVVWNSNIYEHLVTTLSLCILTASIFWGLAAVHSWRQTKNLATAIILFLSIIYGSIAAFRALAAIQVDEIAATLSFWDEIFIITSLAVTFLFALAQFLHGYGFIQQKNEQRLQELTSYLLNERELTSKLYEANQEQQNLQRLLLHEFKRPLSTLDAALQVNDPKQGFICKEKMERLRVLTRQACAYLDGIAQYQDVSELFQAPNCSFVCLSDIAKDIGTKWDVQVMIDDQLAGQKVLCDPLLLDIAVGNLIENANKFSKTPKGVSVLLERFDDMLRIDIQDNGPGIPNTEWEQVWQKFYKLDTETKSVLTGCGLGLYIVAEVARVHKGHASVVSTQPSVVRLELPLTEKANADD